jgi:hypothetical protein
MSETREEYERKVAEANDQPARLKRLDKQLRAMGIPKPAPGQSMGEVRNRKAKEAYEKKTAADAATAAAKSKKESGLQKIRRALFGREVGKSGSHGSFN